MNLINHLKKELKAWKARFIAIHNRTPGIEDIKNESDMEKKYCQYRMLKKRRETFKFIQTYKDADEAATDVLSGQDAGIDSKKFNPESLGLEILVDDSNTIEELTDLLSSNNRNNSLSYDSIIAENMVNETEIPSMESVLNDIDNNSRETLWNDITNTRIQGGPTACSGSEVHRVYNNNEFSLSASEVLNNPNNCSLTDSINLYLNEFPASADVTSVEAILDEPIGFSNYTDDNIVDDNGGVFRMQRSNRSGKNIASERQRTNKIKLDLRKGYHSKLTTRKSKQSKTAMELSSCNSGNFDETALNICHSSDFLSNEEARNFILHAEPIFNLLNDREYAAVKRPKSENVGLMVNGPSSFDTGKILTTLLVSKVSHSVNRILLKLYSKEDTKKLSLYRERYLFKQENTLNLEFLELNSFVSFGTQNYIVETCKNKQTYLVLFVTIENLLNFKLFYSNLYENLIKRSLFSIEEEIPAYLQDYLFKLNDFIYFAGNTEQVNFRPLTYPSISYPSKTKKIEVSAKFTGSEPLKEILNYLQQIRKTYLGPILISTKSEEEVHSVSAYLKTEQYSNETFIPMKKERCDMCLNHFSTRNTWVGDKSNDQTVIDYHKKAYKKKLIVTTNGEHLKYFKGYHVIIQLGFPKDIEIYETLAISHLVILFNPIDYFKNIINEQNIFECRIVLKQLFEGVQDMFIVENDYKFAQSKYITEKSLLHVLNHLVEQKSLSFVCLDKVQFSLEIFPDKNADDFIDKIRKISVFNNPCFNIDLRNISFSEYVEITREIETLKARKIIKLSNIRKGLVFKVNKKIEAENIQDYLEMKIVDSLVKLKRLNDVLFEVASNSNNNTAPLLLSDIYTKIESQPETNINELEIAKNIPEMFKRFVSVSVDSILKKEKEITAIDIKVMIDQCNKKYPKLSRFQIIKTLDNCYRNKINNKE